LPIARNPPADLCPNDRTLRCLTILYAAKSPSVIE
jgi:hypothetical protein